MTDQNEPRTRPVYIITAYGDGKCRCAAHTALSLLASRPAQLIVKSAGRDYCDLWQTGGCDSDPSEIQRAIAEIENARHEGKPW